MKYSLTFEQDTDCESPKDTCDDHDTGRVFLVTTKNRYFQVDHKLIPVTGRSIEVPESVQRTHHIYPLRAYIHSGVALSLGSEYPFSDQWDSGQIGLVCVTKDTSEIPFPEKAAEGLVEQWNQYLSGDVWGYVIKDETGQTIDSCWGFYGRAYAESEGRDALAAVEKNRAEQDEKIAEMMHL